MKPVSFNHHEDEELIMLIRSKDQDGLRRLYDKYASIVFGVSLRIVKREELAQEVLQDTFIRVWQKIDQYTSPKGRFLSWIIGITKNLSIDVLRTKQYKQSSKVSALTEASFDLKTDPASLDLDLNMFVGSLDIKYREVIEMIYFEGHTHVEAAKVLQLPLGTIKTRVRKAIDSLRTIMKDHEY